jgi:Tol biopolymer transport system component
MYDRATKRTILVARGESSELTISPAADRVAFVRSGEDSQSQYIWSMPLDPRTGLAAGPARRVSLTQGDVPSFSPDGKFIAFGRDSVNGQHLTIVPAIGGSERVLARLPGGIRSLQWLPDGKSIYFRVNQSGGQGRGPYSVQRVPSAGGRAEFVMQTTGPGILSPDGRLVLTSTGQRQGLHYVVSDPMGKTLGEFTLSARLGVSAWTGPTTVLTTMLSTPTAITVASLADGRKRRVTDSTSEAVAPVWSPDGRRVAYLQWNDGKLDHVIMNSDGTGKKIIPGHRELLALPFDGGFLWSPDGAAIAYPEFAPANDGTVGTVYVIDAATGREREIITGIAVGGFAWMPDSREILYGKVLDSTRAGKRRELHVVSLAGGDRVLREIVTNCPACLHVIGDSMIVFGRYEATAVALLRNNAAPHQLFPDDTSTMRSNPTVSPDGKWLVFNVGRANFWNAFDIMHPDGSGRHRIELPVRALGAERNAVITSDSRELLYIGRTGAPDHERAVYRVPLAGGEVRKVLALDDATSNTARDYSISPDGKTVAYIVAGRPTTSLGEISLATFLPPAPKR